MRARVALFALALVGLAAPVATAAPLPVGCTFLPVAYECVEESSEPCAAYTAAGGGASGVVGAAFAGYDGCEFQSFLLTASVGPTFLTITWFSVGDACAIVVSSSVATASAPCLAGSPPNPGWGGLLP